MATDENFQLPFRNKEYDDGKKTEHENNEQGKVVSKCRIIASHCFGFIAVSMLKFATGLDVGFTTIIIPELYKTDAEINMSLDELTWFSSYCFMQPVGAILGGFVTQLIGCRLILVIGGMSYITSGLIFYWSTNAAMLLCAQAIVGFVTGMLRAPGYSYLAEISLPQFRSFIMTCVGLCVISGLFTSTVLGTYLYWRTVALINIVFPITGLVLLCFLPESPYWLASKNRHEEAKRSLAWFRGWTTPDSVEDEIRSVFSNYSEKSSSLTNPADHPNSNLSRLDRLKETSKLCFNRSFYIPFLTILFLFFINNLDGMSTMNVFAVLVFKNIDSPVDPHVATILFSVARLLGSIACILFINLAGKRRLLFITLAVSATALSTAATFGYLTSTNLLTSAVYHWIPMISIVTAVLSTSSGIDKISLVLNSEVFPLQLRHVGAGAGHFINTVTNSVMNKIFLYLVEAITISGTLLIFAVANIVGLVGVYFIVPETEGKSLKEIEDHFAGKKSLRKKK